MRQNSNHAAGFLVAALVFSTATHAATYYVNASAASNGAGTQASPKKYISSGAALLAPGDTLIVQPGTYSNANDAITSVPAGSASAWVTIKAATDGSVKITQPLDLGSGNHYLRLEGLKWDYASQKTIHGNYVKVLRCAIKGGPDSGNSVSLLVGTNDATPGAKGVLIEDSWVYGPGGRYKILVYNAEDVILRRVVVRHDGGWTYDGDPQGGVTIYNSRRVRAENVLAIDSVSGLSGYAGGIYLAANGSSGSQPTDVKVSGSIVIGGDGNGLNVDGDRPWSNALFEDSVSWGASSGGFASNGAAHQVTGNRLLVKASGTGFADWKAGGGVFISNSIAYQNGATLSGVSTSNLKVLTGDIAAQGLKYLPRIEVGSSLAALGVGPNITKRIGSDGTLYGESGYETVTSTALWPWPNEARIKTDFAEIAARGWTATSKSLTSYVWEYLGNASPIGSTPPPAPVPPPVSDVDGDSVADALDNCSRVANLDQRDTNGDGYGNLCDADFNNNGIVDSGDGALLKAAFGQRSPDFDMNGNGIVDSNDAQMTKVRFGQAPGPSGLRP